MGLSTVLKSKPVLFLTYSKAKGQFPMAVYS